MNANLLLYLNPEIEHSFDTCGQCCQALLAEQVAKEYLAQNREVDLVVFFEDVEERWRKTPLFKKVKSLIKKGKTLEEISDELEKEGIFI